MLTPRPALRRAKRSPSNMAVTTPRSRSKSSTPLTYPPTSFSPLPRPITPRVRSCVERFDPEIAKRGRRIGKWACLCKPVQACGGATSVPRSRTEKQGRPIRSWGLPWEGGHGRLRVGSSSFPFAARVSVIDDLIHLRGFAQIKPSAQRSALINRILGTIIVVIGSIIAIFLLMGSFRKCMVCLRLERRRRGEATAPVGLPLARVAQVQAPVAAMLPRQASVRERVAEETVAEERPPMYSDVMANGGA